jgi:hypothetical protein
VITQSSGQTLTRKVAAQGTEALDRELFPKLGAIDVRAKAVSTFVEAALASRLAAVFRYPFERADRSGSRLEAPYECEGVDRLLRI